VDGGHVCRGLGRLEQGRDDGAAVSSTKLHQVCRAVGPVGSVCGKGVRECAAAGSVGGVKVRGVHWYVGRGPTGRKAGLVGLAFRERGFLHCSRVAEGVQNRPMQMQRRSTRAQRGSDAGDTPVEHEALNALAVEE
jgi:hypothetical protein